MATSQLIGLEQLPLSGEMFCLNSKLDKAMLITNAEGNFSIVKCEWIDLVSKKMVSKVRFTSQSKTKSNAKSKFLGRKTLSTPHLKFSVFFLQNKQKQEFDVLKIDESFEVTNGFLRAAVDFKKSELQVKNVTPNEVIVANRSSGFLGRILGDFINRVYAFCSNAAAGC